MSIFSKLSRISRIRKLELFNRVMRPAENTKLLDVGAEADPKSEGQLQFIDTYPWKENMTAGNISVEHISTIKEYYPEIEAVVADACDLPWPDKHFDVVYSNAVIEHMGSFERQKKMASEITRVGKRWFVTTPNRWYPFEFHMRLPFVTWLPFNGYLWAGRIVSYDHEQQKYTVGRRRNDLRLMTARELQKCFPGSRVIKQRVTLMAETLIVVGGDVEGGTKLS
ncbi:MAG: methyltransferase domain-containing protein [Planctomycetota bacterium]|nr:methyltransferase domain-containing protein [Planctomycetota bacterium]